MLLSRALLAGGIVAFSQVAPAFASLKPQNAVGSVVINLASRVLAIPAPQVSSSGDQDSPEPPPGNLATVGPSTPIANLIVNILNGNEVGQNNTKGPIPNIPSDLTAQGIDARCFPWYSIADTLTLMFLNTTTFECTDLARAAIRASFHDAGTWARSLADSGQDYGGADGSLYLFAETERTENNGLQEIAALLGELAQENDVGVGDMFQFAAAHATVTCPLGPRVRTFLGRIDAVQAAPPNLLPSPSQDPATLCALFQDKGISQHDLAALLGAHSVSRQFFVNTTDAGESQDSTPGIWDVNFYGETLKAPLPGVFQFQSDVVLSTYEDVAGEWIQFVDDQDHWNEDYASAWIRLSLAGCNNINEGFYECTDALPATNNTFIEPELPDDPIPPSNISPGGITPIRRRRLGK